MTNRDRNAFAGLMLALGEIYAEPVSELRIEAYFDVLRDYELSLLQGVARDISASDTFFPKPANFIERLTPNRGQAAELAWSEMLREIRREGWTGRPTLPAATWAAIEGLWGTWQHLCQTLPAEGPELIGWMKQFQAMYHAKADHAMRGELMSREEAKQLLHDLSGITRTHVPKQLPNADKGEMPTVREGEPLASDMQRRRNGAG